MHSAPRVRDHAGRLGMLSPIGRSRGGHVTLNVRRFYGAPIMQPLSHTQLVEKFASLPRPDYPFPSLENPAKTELFNEYCNWIDQDYDFHSEKARALHKSHRLSDFGANSFPLLTLPELRPITRYATSGAMMDDYFDRCTPDEMRAVRTRVMALLTGQDDQEPEDLGIYHQFYLLRQDAIASGMPTHLYQRFIATIDQVLIGYTDEKGIVATDKPPPSPVYFVVREHTSGGLPFTRYNCMQKDFRTLPDDVLEHPIMLRLYSLCAWMIGIHNDLISLPKELSRKGDKVNLALVLQHERNIPTEEAYLAALDVHDRFLDEFLLLQQNLPSFGRWQTLADDFIDHLGIMVHGLYVFHITTTRYNEGYYVEPEYVSPEFNWATS